MSYIYIPTDRIGLLSIQKSISNTASSINELIQSDITVKWHWRPHHFARTSSWSEGHLYQSGFSIPDSPENREFLKRKQLLYELVEELPSEELILKTSKIALYNGRGAGKEFSEPLVEVLEMGGFSYTYISDEMIRSGELMNYDIFLVPGSPDAGECYYRGLGEKGLEEIRQFLEKKGQYMGICGGAYLPLSSDSPENPCWLNIMDATEDEDLDYWHTGSGFVRCRLDKPEHPLFTGIATGKTTSMNLVYWEGPCIHILGDNVQQLGHFESLLANGWERKPYWNLYDNDMAKEAVFEYYNPLTEKVFTELVKDRSCFAEGSYFNHKVLMISPHPEIGNVGYDVRKDSLNFLLIFNGLFYLSAQ